jgi:hypothetical protein
MHKLIFLAMGVIALGSMFVPVGPVAPQPY